MRRIFILFMWLCITAPFISCSNDDNSPAIKTSVILNEASLNLKIGETSTLIARLIPEEENSDTKILWTSSNIAIATVDNEGKVTAIASGTATITASLQAGGEASTCKVTVTRDLAIGFESYDVFYCSPTNKEMTLVFPSALKKDDYTSITATITSNGGTGVDFQTRSAIDNEGAWNVVLTQPSFTAQGTVNAGSAKVSLILPENVTYYKAILRVTMIDAQGNEHSASRPIWYSTGNIADNTNGSLASKITTPGTITHLTVLGNMNNADFTFIKDNMPSLEVLDLSRTTITEIPERALAFYNNPGNGWNYTDNTVLKTIILPETLTKIGNSAFAQCVGLKEINIPQNLRTLGRWMFEGCFQLENTILPEGITEIPASAFYRMGIKTITIPSAVTTIGGWAFNQCNNLTSITIPASVTSLGESVLRECANLRSADIRANVNTLANNFFYNSQKLTNITLSTSITTLESNSFCNTGLTKFAIPAHVSMLKAGAFNDNINLETVTLPAGIQMEWSTFNGCTKLKNVTIAEGVTEIGAETFRDCKALTEIILPSTITTIRDRAFQGCSALVSLTCKATTTPELAAHNTGENYALHFYGISSSCVLKQPAGTDYSAWNKYFGGGVQTLP